MRVRQAIAYGIDSATAVEVLTAGKGLPTNTLTSPGVPHYAEISKVIQKYQYDLRQVQQLLLQFGIKGKIYESRRGGDTTAVLPDGNGGRKIYAVQEMHSLRISRNSRVLFERWIGFHPASEKAGMNGRVKGLHPAVEDFREADDIGDAGYREGGVAEDLFGAAGGDELPAGGRQATGEVDQVGLVIGGEEGTHGTGQS